MQKRSFSLQGHKTSVALEPEFWQMVELLAKQQAQSLNQFIAQIDGVPPAGNLARKLRLRVFSHLSHFMEAQQTIQTAADHGFIWQDAKGALDKCREELDELEAELEKASDCADNQANIASEFGDCLFSLLSLGHMIGLDAHGAMDHANQKFKSRFDFMQQQANKPFNEMSLDQMEILWQAAKQAGL
ncbi:MAG: ribbon-helix-helix domain-containing protein [Alphaproteobacteria bacterium]